MSQMTAPEPNAAPRQSVFHRINEFLSTSRGFYILISGLVVLHFIIRGLLYPAAPSDDAEQLYFSQVFRWGYDVVNPPLYTWLVIGVQKLVGVEVYSVSLVKFPAYWLIFHFLFLAARRILDDGRLAIVAALSPFWLYYVAWDAVLSYSHSVLATALIMAAFVAVLRLSDKPGVLSYVIFGAVLGLGVLSKYTFGLFALALIVAGLVHRPLRSVLLNPKSLLTLAVFGMIISPHIIWLIDNSDALAPAISGKFEMNDAAGMLSARAKGLGSGMASAAGFLSPLWLVLLVIFWNPVRARMKMNVSLDPWARFLVIYILAIAALLVFFVIGFGVSKIRAHYMFVLIPLPILFFAWLKPALGNQRPARVYTLTLAVISVALVGGMMAKYISEPIRCKRCQLLVPYKDIGQKIRDIGFRGGTIFAFYFPHDLAGNLRTSFPDTRIVSTKYPTITRPPGAANGQCLMIWMPLPVGVKDAKGMTENINQLLGAGLPLKTFPEKPLAFEFHRSNGRMEKFHYMLYDPGVGECR